MAYSQIEGGRSAFKILTVKTTEKITPARPRHRWEDNIRMDFKELGVNARNLVALAQNRVYWRALVNEALRICVP